VVDEMGLLVAAAAFTVHGDTLRSKATTGFPRPMIEFLLEKCHKVG